MAGRRFLAPEVVQTSAMDCGPAALKCLLEGHGIPASYGRLREACQTDVDGTSIDTIEEVANRLGLVAEQAVLPVDHLCLAGAAALPALVVVRQPGGGTHFVVAWRRLGGWLDVMDPASGRRWVRIARFNEDLYRHAAVVPAAAWRDWAAGEAFLAPLAQRMAPIGVKGREARTLRDAALADPGWFGLGALDAGVRMVAALVAAGGIGRGAPARRLLAAVVRETQASAFDIHKAIAPAYWSVTPDPDSTDDSGQHLVLRGAAILRIRGRREGAAADGASLSPELAAALRERPMRPLRLLYGMLREDGAVRPQRLIGAVGVTVAALLIETLLFRALLDVSGQLNLGSQRLMAILAVLAFAGLLLVLQVPLVRESLRLGRHLELRLRMALLAKLPRLADRYFQSRPISDMAERSHGLHVARLLPGTAIHFVQSVCELLLTAAGIILIDPASAAWVAGLVVAAVALPAALQSLLRQGLLRVHSHAAALGGFYLDALMGLVPIRTHRAERAVQRRQEALLVEWARAGRRQAWLGTALEGVQSLLTLGLAGALLLAHFARTGTIAGGDLLLVYWTLKLPEIGRGLVGLAQQFPMQQTVLARLMEPLSAPEEAPAAGTPPMAAGPATIMLEAASVVAAGHTILREVTLSIAAGEHVAIVGPSGAGKSTLIGLLLGWHRVAEGRLLVDGAPLDAAAQDALRRHTAWVDPAVQLWNRSFLDNLGYAAADGGVPRIGEAMEAADLRRVLRDLPDGMQTQLGEGGALLSGGEGQRVRLGRAIAQQDLRLALLDEPFRGLDRERRHDLLQRLRHRWRDVTLLCVTHDVGETRLFDRVLVIEDGRLVENGAPATLASQPSRYAALLAAEETLLERTWRAAEWRRLTIRDGRAVDSA